MRAVYDTPWYEASHDFKVNCMMMVMRAMKPVVLTGGKFYILSLHTFLTVSLSQLFNFLCITTYWVNRGKALHLILENFSAISFSN